MRVRALVLRVGTLHAKAVLEYKVSIYHHAVTTLHANTTLLTHDARARTRHCMRNLSLCVCSPHSQLSPHMSASVLISLQRL